MSEKLYPDLPVAGDEIHKVKQRERIRFMKDKRQQLQLKMKHYEKLKRRWNIIKNVSEITGIALTVGSGILTIVVTSGVLGIPLVALLSTTSTTLTALISTIVNKSFITKHRKKLRAKYNSTKELSDKLYLYFEKSSQDGNITVEEMEKFEKILNIDSTPTTPDSFLEQLSILLKQHSST